jgi:hypothetical protein
MEVRAEESSRPGHEARRCAPRSVSSCRFRHASSLRDGPARGESLDRTGRGSLSRHRDKTQRLPHIGEGGSW